MPQSKVPVALLLLLSAPALAQGPPSPELSRALARAWSLPASQAEALAGEPGVTVEDLAVAQMVAKSAGKSAAEAWALRVAAGSWSGAAAKAGLDPTALATSVEARLSETTLAALKERGEPFVVAALVRTLERLTGRAVEPLARDLARRSFDSLFAELAGVRMEGASPQPERDQPRGEGPISPPPRVPQVVMPYPGLHPSSNGTPPPR